RLDRAHSNCDPKRELNRADFEPGALEVYPVSLLNVRDNARSHQANLLTHRFRGGSEDIMTEHRSSATLLAYFPPPPAGSVLIAAKRLVLLTAGMFLERFSAQSWQEDADVITGGWLLIPVHPASVRRCSHFDDSGCIFSTSPKAQQELSPVC